MHIQAASLCEGLQANIALERSFASVNRFVFFQGVGQGKTLLTNAAFEWFFLYVDTFLMDLQRLLSAKLFKTNVTFPLFFDDLIQITIHFIWKKR